MSRGLGAVERAILLACLKRRQEQAPKRKRRDEDPDLYRDELPGILWGWAVSTSWASHARMYSYHYPNVPAREYRTGQATLTRALQSLDAKGLIWVGGSYFCDGLNVYSARRAVRLGIEARKPLTDAELDEVHIPHGVAAGYPAWTHRRNGNKPRDDRNVKTLCLTDAGLKQAETLSVNSPKQIGELAHTGAVDPA